GARCFREVLDLTLACRDSLWSKLRLRYRKAKSLENGSGLSYCLRRCARPILSAFKCLHYCCPCPFLIDRIFQLVGPLHCIQCANIWPALRRSRQCLLGHKLSHELRASDILAVPWF